MPNTIPVRKHKPKPMLDKNKLLKDIEKQYYKPYKLRLWKVWEIYQTNPKNFDCSSLTMWLHFLQGYKLPRRSSDQYKFCEKIRFNQVKFGDLFFLARKIKNKTVINHVGIYIGSGICMEAAGGRAGKVIRSLPETLMARKNFAGWGRVPLSRAEANFFDWVKKYPVKKENASDPSYYKDTLK